MRDPSNYVNLTTTTPVVPQTRSIEITQSVSRVERLRYWRRINEADGVTPPSGLSFDSVLTTFDSVADTWDANA